MRLVYGEAVAFGQRQREACDRQLSQQQFRFYADGWCVATEALKVGLHL